MTERTALGSGGGGLTATVTTSRGTGMKSAGPRSHMKATTALSGTGATATVTTGADLSSPLGNPVRANSGGETVHVRGTDVDLDREPAKVKGTCT